MIASILIIGVSLILFVYWFRYSCILLLRNCSEEADGAADSRFGFPQVQEQLKSSPELDPLWRSLDRDYRMISYLLQHAPALGLPSFEDRVLVLDYKIMEYWYRFARSAAPQQARNALSEMASVLHVLAFRIGQQAGVRNEA